MNDSIQERIVKNNLTFRAANEKIRAKADEYDAPMERIPFLCECPVPDCREIVRLRPGEYLAVRENPRHFVTAPGHEEFEAPIGNVASREDGYVIVEKRTDRE